MDGSGNRGRNLLSNGDESGLPAFDQLAEFLCGLEVNFVFLSAFDLHAESAFRAGLLSFVPAVICESPGEKASSLLESPSRVAGAHNDGDQAQIAAFGRGNNAVARFSVGACLKAIEAAKLTNESICISEGEFSVPKGCVLGFSPPFRDWIFQ